MDYLVCQEALFVNNPLDIKENNGRALDFAPHLSRLFRSHWVWTFCIRLVLYFPNACLIIGRVSVSLFFWDLHKIWCCSFVGSIAILHQARYTTPNERMWKISASTQPREVLYTDSQAVLILSSTVISRYYNYCTSVPEIIYSPSYLTEIRLKLRRGFTLVHFTSAEPEHL
jgi:hypothetical protein